MPILDTADEQHLRPWLIRTLEPICDADPKVLSDYVLALVKHDEPEGQLRATVQQQLVEFLESEAAPFVDELFHALRTKSFIPYDYQSTSSVNSSAAIPIPLDALVRTEPRGTKRRVEYDNGEFARYREPPKGPRRSLDQQRPHNARSGAPPSGPRAASGDSRVPNGLPGPGSSIAPRDQPRELCRDYHTRGYCPRGELCKFQHSEEAIVPPIMPGGVGMTPMNPIQMMSMLQGGFPLPWMMGAPNGGTYNPNDAQMDMSTPFPNGRGEPTKPYQPADAVNLTPTLVRPQSTSYPDPNIVQPTLEIAGDYTSPSQPSPGEDFTHRGRGRGRSGQQRGRGQGYSQRGTFPNADQQLSFPDPSEPTPVTAESSSTYPSKRPGRNDSKTIVVERIPAESLSLSAISAYFSKFGTVTNVAIDAPTSKALISFSTHEEAHAAWNNQEAVFGNRFVKVFWHRPMGGHGGEGARKLAASAPLVQNLMTSTDSAKPPLTPLSSTPDGIPSTSATRPGSVSVMGPVAPAVTPAASIAARKALLEKQIGEQKALFASLESASSPEKKKEIMGKLRVIAEEMKKDPLLPATSALSNKRTSMGVGAANASALDEQRQQRAREKLDRELEIHASKGIPGASESAGSANGGDTNRQSQLLAELAALRKQAEEVGVSKTEITGSSHRGVGRGYPRGRAMFRGRGAYAGRGAAPVRSLKLDNRPRKLAVRGVDSGDGASVSTLENWYKAIGPLDSFEVVGTDEVHVQLQTRALAEQALAKGAPPGSTSVAWAPTTKAATTGAGTNHLPPSNIDSGEAELVLRTAGDTEDVSAEVERTEGTDEAEVLESLGSTDVADPSSRLVTSNSHDVDVDAWGAGGGFDD